MVRAGSALVFALTLHVAVCLLVGFWATSRYFAILESPSLPKMVGLAGVSLAVGWAVWLMLPLFLPWGTPSFFLGLGRRAEYYLGWAWVAAGGIFLFIIVFRLYSQRAKGQVLAAEDPLEPWRDEPEVEQDLTRRLRVLKEGYCHEIGADALEVRYTHLGQLPFSTGLLVQRLYAPVSLIGERNGTFFEPLMNHVLEHARANRSRLYSALVWVCQVFFFQAKLLKGIRWAFEVEADRCFLARAHEDTAVHYLWALEEGTRAKHAVADDWGLGHGHPAAELRVQQATSALVPWKFRQIGPVVLMVGLGLFSTLVCGGFNGAVFKSFLLKREVVGYKLRIHDPRVQIRSLVGEGGVVPDGISMETTQAFGNHEISSFAVLVRRNMPTNAESAEVSFDWRLVKTSPTKEFPSVSIRAGEELACAEFGEIREWLYDFHALYLGEDGRFEGSSSLPIRLRPQGARHLQGAQDLIFGPDFCVPPGWRLDVKHFRIRALDTSVPISEAEAGKFVAWYRRNLGGNEPLNLTWGQ